MTDSDDHDEVGDIAPPELCAVCRAVILDKSEVYDLVPDSSAIHAREAMFDGKRVVVACSREHLAELREKYRDKPFVDEELWTGKIVRSMQAHPEGMDQAALARETGLTPEQIEQAIGWQNARFRNWAARRSKGEDDGDVCS